MIVTQLILIMLYKLLVLKNSINNIRWHTQGTVQSDSAINNLVRQGSKGDNYPSNHACMCMHSVMHVVVLKKIYISTASSIMHMVIAY